MLSNIKYLQNLMHNSPKTHYTLFTYQIPLLTKVFQDNIMHRVECADRHIHLDSTTSQSTKKPFRYGKLLSMHKVFENDIRVNENSHNYSNTILIKQSFFQQFLRTTFRISHETT